MQFIWLSWLAHVISPYCNFYNKLTTTVWGSNPECQLLTNHLLVILNWCKRWIVRTIIITITVINSAIIIIVTLAITINIIIPIITITSRAVWDRRCYVKDTESEGKGPAKWGHIVVATLLTWSCFPNVDLFCRNICGRHNKCFWKSPEIFLVSA